MLLTDLDDHCFSLTAKVELLLLVIPGCNGCARLCYLSLYWNRIRHWL